MQPGLALPEATNKREPGGLVVVWPRESVAAKERPNQAALVPGIRTAVSYAGMVYYAECCHFASTEFVV